jgi:chlorobactene glucosyltransferase
VSIPLLLTLPWILVGSVMAFGIRFPRPLPQRVGPSPSPLPPVSIIVPARNEEHNIGRCVSSLAAQDHPDFEILVVDDRSTDGTVAVVQALPRGNARQIRVIEGEPLPPGWFGKPWACMQGARAAGGRVLLFTDADTVHSPGLLSRCIAAMEEDGAGGLSLVGRQIMETFWERVVQPHIFALIGMRFPRLHIPIESDRWPEAVANGQYVLVDREAYDRVGGHAVVKGEVVEDLRLAQELVRSGVRLTVRGAEDVFATRMYRNLRELVEGWTKNLATGARQVVPSGLGALVIPGLLLYLLGLWVLPSLLLVATLLVAPEATGVLLWAGITTGCGLAIWVAGSRQMGAPALYGVFFPLGAATTAFILLRSWLRGAGRIEWKGRRYASGALPGEGGAETAG